MIVLPLFDFCSQVDMPRTIFHGMIRAANSFIEYAFGSYSENGVTQRHQTPDGDDRAPSKKKQQEIE